MSLMAENDILWFFFKLHPLVVALTVWFLGFGSLLLVAIKTKSLKENIIKSPGVIIGDFFLLPFAGFLISQSYQNVVSSTMLVSSSNWNFLLIISVTLALISTIRFNHKSIWWLPHNVFYFLMCFIVLLSKHLFLKFLILLRKMSYRDASQAPLVLPKAKETIRQEMCFLVLLSKHLFLKFLILLRKMSYRDALSYFIKFLLSRYQSKS